ncbi:hypothetical protein VNI00_018963 [Paramarasmius palmivorus]|uniref:Uncharacterized protein n=1 Tax=Paramarasmius palmivorus TaxID=297713 RepID=A0AAW0AS58_9AGAR
MQGTTQQSIQKLFDASETCSGQSYSPYLAGADEELEALLLRAFLIAENPENESPLSTPPSSPPDSPRIGPQDLELLSSAPSVPETEGFTLSTTSTPSSAPTSGQQPSMDQGPHSSRRKRRVKTPAEVAREKAKSKNARRKARRSQPSVLFSRQPEDLVKHSLRASILQAAHVVQQTFHASRDFRPAQSGYLGLEKDLPEKRDYTVDELTDPEGKFRFSKLTHDPSSSRPLTSTSGAVMGVVIPAPQNDPSWAENVQAANQMIERLGLVARFTPPRLTKSQQQLMALGLAGPTTAHPRRGVHNSLAYGPSIGNGQKQPQMMRISRQNQPVLDEIRNSRVFQRMARFMSCGLLGWAPSLFMYYARSIAPLLAKHSDLHLPFEKCIFTAFTVNFGPRTVCYPHRDVKNLAFGWCGITALGDYDWTRGGHFVIWDLKLVVEFPPGTTILIPSAMVCHSNTAISPSEKRYSFAMYTAGGLFRWVEHGFIPEKLYQATRSRAQAVVEGKDRWTSGLALFSTLEELSKTSMVKERSL